MTFIVGDILDYPKLHHVIRGSHIVVHCAAVAGIDTVIKHPTETMRSNMVGTAKVIEAAATLSGLERFVNFSTSEVFGREAQRRQYCHQNRHGHAVGFDRETLPGGSGQSRNIVADSSVSWLWRSTAIT